MLFVSAVIDQSNYFVFGYIKWNRFLFFSSPEVHITDFNFLKENKQHSICYAYYTTFISIFSLKSSNWTSIPFRRELSGRPLFILFRKNKQNSRVNEKLSTNLRTFHKCYKIPYCNPEARFLAKFLKYSYDGTFYGTEPANVTETTRWSTDLVPLRGENKLKPGQQHESLVPLRVWLTKKSILLLVFNWRKKIRENSSN